MFDVWQISVRLHISLRMEGNVVDKLILPLFNVSARQILDAWCGISDTFLSFLIALHSHRKAEVFELQWQRRKERTCRKKVKIKRQWNIPIQTKSIWEHHVDPKLIGGCCIVYLIGFNGGRYHYGVTIHFYFVHLLPCAISKLANLLGCPYEAGLIE